MNKFRKNIKPDDSLRLAPLKKSEQGLSDAVLASLGEHKNVLEARKYVNINGEPVLLFENTSNDSHSVFELLTIAEVAEALKISVSGVRRLQHGRHIPFIKVGGNIRFSRSDIMSYVKKMRVESIE
jgi:excisionase family DNA binding protein